MTKCHTCNDTGLVCEDHQNKPWGEVCKHDLACNCGGAGMPCPICCKDSYLLTDAEIEAFNERAAIIQYDANRHRPEAERLALAGVLAKRK